VLASCAAYALDTVVAGVPLSAVKVEARSRGSTDTLAGERSSLSPRSLSARVSPDGASAWSGAYLSASLVRAAPVFLRFGWGMRHSMEKAVQLVHGMPSEAASQRTWWAVRRGRPSSRITHLAGVAGCESRLASMSSSVDRGAEAHHRRDIDNLTRVNRAQGRGGLLSQALLARCRLNDDGCPGGTECVLAVGLSVVSLQSAMRARATYEAAMLGCAASGGGPAGTGAAMNECSPDIIEGASCSRVEFSPSRVREFESSLVPHPHNGHTSAYGPSSITATAGILERIHSSSGSNRPGITRGTCFDIDYSARIR
jgi:hypothetical protein